MDKAAVSKMLGYMKYHARATNKDMGDRDDASFALAKYNALKGVDKVNFLKSYEQNKGSLKWARSFTSTSTEIESRKAGGRTTGGEEGRAVKLGRGRPDRQGPTRSANDPLEQARLPEDGPALVDRSRSGAIGRK